jgi:xanthine dehydrogenase accessory factor
MRADLLQRAAELARAEVPFVLAIVTSRLPASSAQPGDMALVTAEGDFHGWLGGACTRPTVVREAQAALADGKPRLLALAPDPEEAKRPGVATFPMTCHSGGSVEIYLEPVLPAPRLVLFGASPAVRALARLGQAMGYAITAVGGDADPDAKGLPAGVDSREALAPGELAPSSAARPLYAVVATMGEDDEAAIESALALGAGYLGVVASARRFATLRETLLARGVSAAALATIRSPAGLDLGARTPEEIALAVLAEIVQMRRREATAEAAAASAATASEAPTTTATTTATPAEPAAPAAPPAQAIDPVCGMTVNVARSRHTAEHLGTTYHFCCAGCRDRFEADPTRYAVTELRA